MANLTLTIEDEVLRRARLRALERGTSVNALVREYLEAFSGVGTGQEAVQSFVRLAKRAKASSGGSDRRWTRDELHDR